MSDPSTEIALLPYNLPDAALLVPDGSGGRAVVFVPERVMVVVGRGSNPQLELRAEPVLAGGVPVLRRGTGGCAVVLTPEMAVVSFALYQKEQWPSATYFRELNQVVIRALESLGVEGAAHRGTSDIALGEKKIAGTAIYRNRDLVFYHAILNLAGTTDLMERYLARPPREPDYRAGRSHAEFVTSLAAAGYALDVPEFARRIEAEFALLLEACAA